MGIQRVPNLLRWTVLACCLPYPGDPKSAIDCFFLFGISLHPGVTGSAPHWKFRGCRVHSFPSPQELLRPASWLALLSRTFTFELAPTRSPSISVEYDYVDKQSIPTAGLSPASPTALWAAGHRVSRHKMGWDCLQVSGEATTDRMLSVKKENQCSFKIGLNASTESSSNCVGVSLISFMSFLS